MKKYFKSFIAQLASALLNTSTGAQPPSVTLRLDQSGHAIPPKLYGLMTEEINYSYDGGLYAELIRNRNFTEITRSPDHWSIVADGGAKGTIAPDRQNSLNNFLTDYAASFYARGTTAGEFTVSIESKDGKTVFAKAKSAAVSNTWQQFKLTLTTTDGIMPTADTRNGVRNLVVVSKGKGIVDADWIRFE